MTTLIHDLRTLAESLGDDGLNAEGDTVAAGADALALLTRLLGQAVELLGDPHAGSPGFKMRAADLAEAATAAAIAAELQAAAVDL